MKLFAEGLRPLKMAPPVDGRRHAGTFHRSLVGLVRHEAIRTPIDSDISLS